MDKLVTDPRIKKAVRDALSRDFDNIRIVEVRVNRDSDSDGGDVLKIDVIFDADRKVDARVFSGAVRRLRPKLTEIGEYAFPLMSFISRSDKGLGKFEAA